MVTKEQIYDRIKELKNEISSLEDILKKFQIIEMQEKQLKDLETINNEGIALYKGTNHFVKYYYLSNNTKNNIIDFIKSDLKENIKKLSSELENINL